uniref:Uncharacterized protein n=1 Tax=Panagrellus redivivus TaxID=6233 RepID=A0A7E4UXX2_PANRE
MSFKISDVDRSEALTVLSQPCAAAAVLSMMMCWRPNAKLPKNASGLTTFGAKREAMAVFGSSGRGYRFHERQSSAKLASLSFEMIAFKDPTVIPINASVFST